MTDPQPIDLQNIDFHEIARRGDTEVMEVFLQAGLDPDLPNARAHTLLMIAAYHEQRAMVDLLLDAGARIDAPDTSGNTPLMGLCFKGYADLAAHLLARGADPNARNHAGATPLIMAALFAQAAIVRALLAHGADPHATDGQGRTARDIARAQGLDDLAALLDAGKDHAAGALPRPTGYGAQ